MSVIKQCLDKSGVFGTIIATLGCPACFPAIGAIAASLGLGFLVQFEGLFINTLLPLFVLLSLFSVVISFSRHRSFIRLLAGATGPIVVLLVLYPLWQYDWSTYLFYSGLLLMVSVAIWDIALPATANNCCDDSTLEVTEK